MHLSDIEIAQKATPKKINQIGTERLGIHVDDLDPFGHFKAKISLDVFSKFEKNKNGKLILVTAISPTPAGEGKTTTTVGLGDALNHIGKKAVICLREPSLGPVFGMKGGAAGGGYAQVIPMEDINLHFTGDFNAIQLANNLLAAMIDNHIHHGNHLDFDVRRITWKRVLDMNDRALREIVTCMGGVSNGVPRQDGFDIVVASEVMAILCLSQNLSDLKTRLGNIVCGYSRDGRSITAQQLSAHGAMAVLMKEAIKPNLVQTLENNPAILHGGPFANIAHGCNSVIATKLGLKLADYVVTEAGFGADLGAEKFIDIKCRKAGLNPDLVVLVATIRAIKFHGSVEVKNLQAEDLAALELGFKNVEKHLLNITKVYELPCVVAINHFASDTEAEVNWLFNRLKQMGIKVVIAKHWALGGKGAADLAKEVVHTIEQTEKTKKKDLTTVYGDNESLMQKITSVATKIYGASEVLASPKIKKQLQAYQDAGHGHFPICIAKTQYSFSTNPLLKGAPTGHVLDIREVRLSAGAEFVVVICGDIMTMPGLPKIPSAERIDISEDGKVVGLF